MYKMAPRNTSVVGSSVVSNGMCELRLQVVRVAVLACAAPDAAEVRVARARVVRIDRLEAGLDRGALRRRGARAVDLVLREDEPVLDDRRVGVVLEPLLPNVAGDAGGQPVPADDLVPREVALADLGEVDGIA